MKGQQQSSVQWSISDAVGSLLQDAATSVHQQWDAGWPEVKKNIESQGHSIQCKEQCVSCCFIRRLCTLSEGMAILRYMEKEFSESQRESIRMRVESTASSIQRLRADGFCDSEDSFQRAGGIECPFLTEGRCTIYPVRPLECRAQYVSAKTNVDECRRCPRSVTCLESEVKKFQLQNVLQKEEDSILGSDIPKQDREGKLLPEMLSLLWQKASTPSPKWLMTEKVWISRLASRESYRDETWHDDGFDFRAIDRPLSLPAEGDYYPDLTLLKARSDVHEIYDQQISGETFPEFYTLYKRHPGGAFDWKNRSFLGAEKNQNTSDLPYTCWMSDGPQERLMMWEAAKRSRGRVLCGGLGLGIFPQFALSLPRVDSVHVVEMNEDIIEMSQNSWEKNHWPRMTDCKIIKSEIEEYLASTEEKFDTVYIDTWDAIYHEYLPHLNELTQLSRRVLRPGGEILLWAFDLKVRSFLETAKELATRRDQYLKATEEQLDNIDKKFPLLFRLVGWLKRNPGSSDDELQYEAYRLATRESRSLGILKLSNQRGGQELVNEKYFPTHKPSGS